MLDTGAQAFEFLSAIYAGILIGVFYEICRIIRRFCRNNLIISAVIDTVFWVGAGVITFLGLYIINGARPRWYLFIGIIIGIVLHFYSLGIIISYITRKILAKNKEKKVKMEG